MDECIYCSAKPYPIRDVLLSEAALLSKNCSEYSVSSVDGKPVASFGPVDPNDPLPRRSNAHISQS